MEAPAQCTSCLYYSILFSVYSLDKDARKAWEKDTTVGLMAAAATSRPHSMAEL